MSNRYSPPRRGGEDAQPVSGLAAQTGRSDRNVSRTDHPGASRYPSSARRGIPIAIRSDMANTAEIVVITGASAGVGRATVREFAERGAAGLERRARRGGAFGWASFGCSSRRLDL